MPVDSERGGRDVFFTGRSSAMVADVLALLPPDSFRAVSQRSAAMVLDCRESP